MPATMKPDAGPVRTRPAFHRRGTGRLAGRPHAHAAPAAAPAVGVLLCESNEVYRIGLRTVIEASGDLAVVGEAASAAEALALAAGLRPQVVLVGSPGAQDAAEELIGCLTRLCAGVVVLTEQAGGALPLLRAGARGCLHRPAAPARLLEAVRAVARHETLLDAAAAESLLQLLTGPVPAPGPRVPQQRSADTQPSGFPGVLDDLTRRQRDVTELVAEGLNNSEIAARLHLGEATVKSHLATVLRKYGLRDRTQLAIMTLRSHPADRATA